MNGFAVVRLLIPFGASSMRLSLVILDSIAPRSKIAYTFIQSILPDHQ
jgi:hypothetical protein